MLWAMDEILAKPINFLYAIVSQSSAMEAGLGSSRFAR